MGQAGRRATAGRPYALRTMAAPVYPPSNVHLRDLLMQIVCGLIFPLVPFVPVVVNFVGLGNAGDDNGRPYVRGQKRVCFASPRSPRFARHDMIELSDDASYERVVVQIAHETINEEYIAMRHRETIAKLARHVSDQP